MHSHRAIHALTSDKWRQCYTEHVHAYHHVPPHDRNSQRRHQDYHDSSFDQIGCRSAILGLCNLQNQDGGLATRSTRAFGLRGRVNGAECGGSWEPVDKRSWAVGMQQCQTMVRKRKRLEGSYTRRIFISRMKTNRIETTRIPTSSSLAHPRRYNPIIDTQATQPRRLHKLNDAVIYNTSSYLIRTRSPDQGEQLASTSGALAQAPQCRPANQTAGAAFRANAKLARRNASGRVAMARGFR